MGCSNVELPPDLARVVTPDPRPGPICLRGSAFAAPCCPPAPPCRVWSVLLVQWHIGGTGSVLAQRCSRAATAQSHWSRGRTPVLPRAYVSPCCCSCRCSHAALQGHCRLAPHCVSRPRRPRLVDAPLKRSAPPWRGARAARSARRQSAAHRSCRRAGARGRAWAARRSTPVRACPPRRRSAPRQA